VHDEITLRLIPLLPLAAAAINGLWLLLSRRELPRAVVAVIACGAPALSFVFAVRAVARLFGDFPPDERYLTDIMYNWISAHPFHVDAALLLDPLSAMLVLVVTGVGTLIHVYSVGYMAHDDRPDRGFQRFFTYMNLFMFSMLMLVLGDNLLVMFVGWEGVGLCSYLLIGFWYSADHNAMCGQKAFIVNRIGDFGFLLGIFLLFWAYQSAGVPTIELAEMRSLVPRIAEQTVSAPSWLSFLPDAPSEHLLTLAGILLFIGACGKSAQIPLYVWLPDAMAGPTPVSALIHAATMVTAGVYMVARMSFAYAYAPWTMGVIAWVGGLTALFAAIIGTCQRDIKKVLAYSTVSQLGYMFLAAGASAYGAAVFHLITHAWFKALLFLGAGSVILGMHHEQDIGKMGGLRHRMPITHWTFLAGVVAISGVPLTSGFFSKDEILLGVYLAHDLPGHTALYAMGVVTAMLTAFYMWRLYFMVFGGESRADHHTQSHIHEQPLLITAPLMVLAALSLAGWVVSPPDWFGDLVLGWEDSNTIHHALLPVVREAEHGALGHATEFALMGIAIAMSAIGIAAAWVLYVARPELPARFVARAGIVYRVVLEKFYVDEIYDALIVRPTLWISRNVLYKVFDAGLIDGVCVGGTALFVRGVADRGLKFLQNGSTQSYVFGMVIGCVIVLMYMVGEG
jgi:NADH-quinone oxidoreductase subunit L